VTGANLPEGFADLEPFVADWVLPTSTDRTRKRNSSQMSEITAFYDTMQPRLEDVLEHLSLVPYNETMPEDEHRLLGLALSLAEITPAVEWYGQPGVIDGFDPERFVLTTELL